MGTAISIPVIAALQLVVGYVARVSLIKHKFDPGPGPAIPGEIFGRFGQYALSYFSWDTAYSLGWAVTYLVFFVSVVLRASLSSAWSGADEQALDAMSDAETLLITSYALLVFWYPLAVLITWPDTPAVAQTAPSNEPPLERPSTEPSPGEGEPLLPPLPTARVVPVKKPMRAQTRSLVTLGRVAAVLQAALVCTAAVLSVVGLATAGSFSRDSFAPLLFGELTWGFYSGFLTFCCATSVGVAVRRLQVSPRGDYTHDVGTYLIVESCIQQLVFNLQNTKDNALASSFPKAIDMAKRFVNPAASEGKPKEVDKSVLDMFEQAREVATVITQTLTTDRKLVTDNQRQSATRYITVPYIRHRGLMYVASKERAKTAGDNAKAPFYELQLGTIVPTLVVCTVAIALPSPCFALGAMLGFVFIINHDISPVRVLRALVALSFAVSLVRAVMKLVE